MTEQERLHIERIKAERKKFLEKVAAEIPAPSRKAILEENWIHTAINLQEANTPIEFLFELYEEYIDVTHENNDFSCHLCRQKALETWKAMEPYLKQLEYETNTR